MIASSYNIGELFTSVAARVPQRTALVCGRKRRSYDALHERSTRLATGLSNAGVAQGQHVALYLRNCVEYVESMLACFRIGAVPININYRYTGAELSDLFHNADIVACISQPEYRQHVRQLLREPGSKLRLAVITGDDIGAAATATDGLDDYEALIAGSTASPSTAPRSGRDRFILYTGGTTGRPKGVVWEHESLFFATLGGDGRNHPDGPITHPSQVAGRVDPDRHTVMAPLAPLMHGAAWWPTTSALLAGNTVVLYGGRAFDAEAVVQLLQAERVNGVALVGDAMAIPLLRAMRAEGDLRRFRHLRLIGSGGAVFSHWVQESFRQLLPGVTVVNAFGSSETGSQGSDSGQGEEGLGCLRVTENTNVIGEDHRLVRPGSGETGHLARTGHIPLEYYGDPQASAGTFVEIGSRRWVITGDMATVKDNGDIIVFGRGSNCINSGGEKVFPEEVEQVIKQHPAVEDALVIGVADQRLGSRVAAVVAFSRGHYCEYADLQAYTRQFLAGYKVPKTFAVAQRIQRSPAGKPDYAWARRTLEEDTPAS